MNLINETKKIGLGLLYMIIMVFIIRFFHLNTIQVIGLLMFTSLVFQIYTKSFTYKGCIISWSWIVLIVIGLKLVGKLGVFGIFAGVLLIPAIIILRKWKQFIEVKEKVESMLWGKPLKEYVKNGEKPPKIVLSK